jgi:hypothetical protein
MTKNYRRQGVVNRQSDESYSEDHWLKEFENKLQKTSVQPRGQSLYDQISSIMNSKSKYPSVQAAVDDMMHRSGLTAYLENVKTSTEEASDKPKKIAQDNQQAKHTHEHKNKPSLKILEKIPGLKRTLENIIKETRGNMPISAVVARLQSLHSRDTSDESIWDDDELLRLISHCNLEAKKSNPGVFENFDNLGQTDHGSNESDIDASNTDAFNALMPAKI